MRQSLTLCLLSVVASTVMAQTTTASTEQVDPLSQYYEVRDPNKRGTNTPHNTNSASAAHRHVEQGRFRDNMNRLSKLNGVKLVVWDPRAENCDWRQDTSYDIPESEPRDILRYYAQTQNFVPVFSNVDGSMKLLYVGPISTLRQCQ